MEEQILAFAKTIFQVAPEWGTLLIIVVVVLKSVPLKELFKMGQPKKQESCGNAECYKHLSVTKEEIEKRFLEFRNDVRGDLQGIRDDIRELRQLIQGGIK